MAITYRVGSQPKGGLSMSPSDLFSRDTRAKWQADVRRKEKQKEIERGTSVNRSGNKSGRRSKHSERVAAAADQQRYGTNTGGHDWKTAGARAEKLGHDWKKEPGWDEGKRMSWQRFQPKDRPTLITRNRSVDGTVEEPGYTATGQGKRTGGSRHGQMQGSRVKARLRSLKQKQAERDKKKMKVVGTSTTQREAV